MSAMPYGTKLRQLIDDHRQLVHGHTQLIDSPIHGQLVDGKISSYTVCRRHNRQTVDGTIES